MLPGLLMALHRIYDFTVELLENSNLTFQFKGPLLSGMDMLVTVDPANIHYMLSSNFLNYNKGPEFKEVFDVFKDVIFNVDAELCATRSKLKNGLVPVFDHFAKEGMVLNFQDVFRRFTFDTSMVLITGSDPTSLSIDMPENEVDKALTEAIEGILYRHVKPRFLWKLQRWMGLGIEKKMLEADDIFYRVCAKYISAKREEVRLQGINHQSPSGEAGRDTIASALTWFFWILSENPNVTAKIRQEINKNMPKSKTGQEKSSLDPNELNKMVYLYGALYESMRLYPPAPFERTLRHEPSFKFLAFNAGPRSCLGKQLAMNLMKTVIVEILQNYDIHVIKGQKIEPLPSLILRMKHGLSVTITKRD
ncbi:hypothetical protein F2Q69_00055892 [Brassica cretica]|uniref:Cytochrome P450 n=1 Tax=Brassica cretica TaxID=69181 RepID=A0A8S9N1I7_BRACR|nr:hypothetical protein F2Q69_00055892 [Brassica cretica]